MIFSANLYLRSVTHIRSKEALLLLRGDCVGGGDGTPSTLQGDHAEQWRESIFLDSKLLSAEGEEEVKQTGLMETDLIIWSLLCLQSVTRQHAPDSVHILFM